LRTPSGRHTILQCRAVKKKKKEKKNMPTIDGGRRTVGIVGMFSVAHIAGEQTVYFPGKKEGGHCAHCSHTRSEGCRPKGS
jgi:hypothetical protein